MTTEEALAHDVLQAWSIEPRSIELVHTAPNIVYRLSGSSGEKMFLRLTPATRRDSGQVEAELEFISFLAAQRFNTSPPLRQTRAGLFHAALFPEAPGTIPSWSSNDKNLQLLASLGRTLAELHELSSRFVPTGARRFSWRDDVSFMTLHHRLPDFEADVKREAEAVFNFLETLPTPPQQYGLIHGDFTLGNVLQHADRLAIIDFDDCCYHWYEFDIAVALHAAARLPPDVRGNYETTFLNAYQSIRPLDKNSRQQLSWFHRLVNLTRYYYALRNWDLVNLGDADVKELETRRQTVIAGPAYGTVGRAG